MAQMDGLSRIDSAPLAAASASTSFHDSAMCLEVVEAENAVLRGEIERLNAAAITSRSSVETVTYCCPSYG
jgi:hypothetical protein